MSSLKKEHDNVRDKPHKEFHCSECNKTFSKSSSFYNHRKLTHGYKPAKDNERGRPIKSEARPFERVLAEIFESPRKAMQDKYFPELAKILLKIVRKNKDFYDKVFDTLEKFDKDFEQYVDRTLQSEDCPELEFLKIKNHPNELKRFFRILLDNWRLTLKLTDAFCKELAVIMGFFFDNHKIGKETLAEEIKEKLDLNIILTQGLNNVCDDEDFVEHFLEILLTWKKNYNLK